MENENNEKNVELEVKAENPKGKKIRKLKGKYFKILWNLFS